LDILKRRTYSWGVFVVGSREITLNRRVSGWVILVVVVGMLGPMLRAGAEGSGGVPYNPTKDPDAIRAQIAGMTLEEKVGQLFMITLYSSELGDTDRHLIETIHPGGVVLFPHNIRSPEQIARLTNDLQSYAQQVGPDVPLLIAVDEEGGRVSRLQDGFTIFPPPVVLGATDSTTDAIHLGYAMGQELAAVGINVDLAPVTDLHYPAQEAGEWQVLYRRTLSSDPVLIGRLAGGMVEGMRRAGVIGVLKHFPGHGAATVDSHNELPTIDMTREEVDSTALAAFAGAIGAGAPAVMVGHLYYPALDPVARPASISPAVIGVLRGQLDFEGVTISDAMQMGGIRADYDVPDAVVKAISAGIDLITFGPYLSDQIESAQAVIDAVRSGTIPEARIDEAVGHVLALRAAYGLLDWSPVDAQTVGERVGGTRRESLLAQLAQDAVTVVADEGAILPLDPAQKIAVIYPGVYTNIGRACAENDPDVMTVEYTLDPTDPEEFTAAAYVGRTADRVVIFIEDFASNPDQVALVKVLPPEKTVVVNLRAPYDYDALPPGVAAYVMAYQSAPEARVAVCRVLYGAAAARGRLPFAVGPYPVGTGVQYDAIRAASSDAIP
jgi:beta-N-acetylhexosaminidase